MGTQILFLILLALAIFFFARSIGRIRGMIALGKERQLNHQKAKRWGIMARVALGQSKMVKRPISGVLHILVYLGFIIINLEVLEIILDGLLGTHRLFAPLLGSLYAPLIASFEVLAILVLLACLIFLVRRNILKVKRFWNAEMKSWPRTDANVILLTEIALMAFFLIWNASDQVLQSRGIGPEISRAAFPVSSLTLGWFQGWSTEGLQVLERACWWGHIVGILAFLNYIPFSKHFHIFLAFPNTWYSRLEPAGTMEGMSSVTQEVKAMMDPEFTPETQAAPGRFGAKDVTDLSWKNIMDALSCTECGRCTSVCPANQTGKLLSPRKIMMDTRDRAEDLYRAIKKAPKTAQENKGAALMEAPDGKSLLGDYISKEEILACTTCNACVEACPVLISPLEIILDLRRFMVMEEASAPSEWNMMFGNVENNGAPWQFSRSDRDSWTRENN